MFDVSHDDDMSGWAHQAEILHRRQAERKSEMTVETKQNIATVTQFNTPANAVNMPAQHAKNPQYDISPEIMERVIAEGDLKSLTPAQRVEFYRKTCESMGLNPLTRPFEYIILNNKLTFYARKDCTEQLRSIRKIAVTKIETKQEGDVYIVTAYGTDAEGRADVATGVVNIANLKGDALANAYMKAETKAKRRLTLSISGMAFVDETEISSIPNTKNVTVNFETGEMHIEEEKFNGKTAAQILHAVKFAPSMESLSILYNEVAKKSPFMNDPEFKTNVFNAKNERKAYLEAEAKKVSDDFFRGTEDNAQEANDTIIEEEPQYQDESVEALQANNQTT